MAKFIVCLYQEIYSDIEVEANSAEEASEKVMLGEFEDPIDVTVKSSEIISTEESV